MKKEWDCTGFDKKLKEKEGAREKGGREQRRKKEMKGREGESSYPLTKLTVYCIFPRNEMTTLNVILATQYSG